MGTMKVLVLGAGKIGSMIATLLTQTGNGAGDFAVTVGDRDEELLARAERAGFRIQRVDVEDDASLRAAVAGQQAVVSACPFSLTPRIAAAAVAAGAHYLDLTEDVAATRAVKALAETANSALIPQCGLAPGFISVVGHDLARRFDELHNLHLRVGALPQYPTNALKYNLTWSTDGLINEYCNPCEAIVDGVPREVMPLEGDERFALDGVDYEAFNTSGGLGSLCATLAGKVRNLDYKTVRYPGHRDIVRLLIRDLRLGERRHLLKDVLETAVPLTLQDVVLVVATATGRQEGELRQETFVSKIYSKVIPGPMGGGRTWSAIQVTTAAGVCAILDLLREGSIPQAGFVRQEQVPLALFLANRFGRYYAA
ncbi:saccharopine dehydrogenase-like NADP-dependent oxidoreductase [Azospirillum agricola]|uniref:saccharopine dehydrogenase family protein n=1 Tax=Azospirillum agricola TaxID=1720247 RepID=UPI001AE742A8|nr:saccharopine dehydrogenase NADP-binding domain-containing protein [Azospirillum agricola]MBP2231618.1 saccharopine dehydrogenase-like NADP-dependent oxidoreductase [Azospirillum agricola]